MEYITAEYIREYGENYVNKDTLESVVFYKSNPSDGFIIVKPVYVDIEDDDDYCGWGYERTIAYHDYSVKVLPPWSEEIEMIKVHTDSPWIGVNKFDDDWIYCYSDISTLNYEYMKEN